MTWYDTPLPIWLLQLVQIVFQYVFTLIVISGVLEVILRAYEAGRTGKRSHEIPGKDEAGYSSCKDSQFRGEFIANVSLPMAFAFMGCFVQRQLFLPFIISAVITWVLLWRTPKKKQPLRTASQP